MREKMKLENIEKRFKTVRAELEEGLLREYPVGTGVSMMLSSRQILPSTGCVIGAGDPGTLRVRIESIGGMVRDIPWKDIINKREPK
jgi:hypothetical protein